MNVSSAVSQVNSISSKVETIFKHLESLFPQLTSKSGHTTFDKLKSELYSVTGGFSSKNSGFIENFADKYNPLFEKLNEKITDLKSLDKLIAEIKEDSEQMELIALNAMVISVKSGEKGLAFSKITENLQRLSKDMFVYSDKLSGEEVHLLEEINELKTIFSGIIDSQRSISSKDSECNSEIQRMNSNVSPVLSELSVKVDSIYPAIDRTKSVTKNRSQISTLFSSLNSSLNSENYERAYENVSTLSSLFSEVCSSFAGNWSEVIEIMESGDTMRMDFESRFLNNHAFGNDNIARQLSSIINKYEVMVSEFNEYHSVQKDLQAICDNIISRAKTIYAVFENLRPVMSRLHHVRILQQIEVSKNDAIKSVQDSVTDMDNLINEANKSLDDIQAILESFIQDTNSMLAKFTRSISSDNESMIELRAEKEVILGDLNNTQATVAEAFSNFTVFPDDLQKKCVLVQQNLQDFMRLNSEIASLAYEIESEKNSR